jgi:hypothetical protein
MVFRIMRTEGGGKVKLRRETSPIVYRRVRSAATLNSAYSFQYERFVREERARVAQRRRLTIVAVAVVVLFALFARGAV